MLTMHMFCAKILIIKMKGVFIMSSVNMTIRMDKDTKEKYMPVSLMNMTVKFSVKSSMLYSRSCQDHLSCMR